VFAPALYGIPAQQNIEHEGPRPRLADTKDNGRGEPLCSPKIVRTYRREHRRRFDTLPLAILSDRLRYACCRRLLSDQLRSVFPIHSCGTRDDRLRAHSGFPGI
jgi:hypothetical protein